MQKINDQIKLESLTLEITSDCPMRCEFCSSNVGRCRVVSYSLKEMKSIVDEVSTLGCKTISLSGGEPLVHPRILEISKYIKDKGICLHIYTSGNLSYFQSVGPLSALLVSDLKTSGVDRLIFSIHGGEPELHDSVTNVKGSFKNLIDSIRITKNFGLKTELHFVVTKKNYREFPKIYSIAKQFNVDLIRILRLVPQGAGATSRSLLELDIIETEDFKIIIKNFIKNSTVPIRVGSYYSIFGLKEENICTAAIKKASILPDGYMVPCSSMKEDIFKREENNIKKYSIREIWYKSTLFIETRLSSQKIFNTPCSKCPYYKVCHGGCPAQRILSYGSIEGGPDPLCNMNGIWSSILVNSIDENRS